MGSSHPGDGPGRPGIRQMEEGRDMNPDIGVGEMDLGNGSKCMRRDVLMRQHDPFGTTRRTACIIDLGDVFIGDGDLRKRTGDCFLKRLLHIQIERPRKGLFLSGPKEPFDPPRLFPDGVNLPFEHRVCNQYLRFGILEDIGNLSGRETGIDGDRDRSDLGYSIVGFQKVMAIGKKDRNLILFPHTQAFEADRETADSIVELPVGPSPSSAYDGLLLRKKLVSFFQGIC